MPFLKLLLTCTAIIVTANAYAAQLGDYLKDGKGNLRTDINRFEADKLCQAQGSRLPTIKELAVEERKNGAEVVEVGQESDKKFVFDDFWGGISADQLAAIVAAAPAPIGDNIIFFMISRTSNKSVQESLNRLESKLGAAYIGRLKARKVELGQKETGALFNYMAERDMGLSKVEAMNADGSIDKFYYKLGDAFVSPLVNDSCNSFKTWSSSALARGIYENKFNPLLVCSNSRIVLGKARLESYLGAVRCISEGNKIR